jgi:hypothetical protein
VHDYPGDYWKVTNWISLHDYPGDCWKVTNWISLIDSEKMLAALEKQAWGRALAYN